MTLKEKMKQQELTIGSWITMGNTSVAEIMANAGYDWLTVDMEHSAITINCAQELIRVIELCGVSPLVRVGANDPNLIKRVMDSGAHGVIVPMVNSRQDAEKAVGAVKYPPHGFRGVGLARAQKYGVGFDDYKEWNAAESIVIVQIEHIQAVENFDGIISVPGVDGFIVGPYDLSGSLGIPGQFDHPDMRAALNKVQEASKRTDALAGYHVVPPEVAPFHQAVSEGYRFIAHSLDILLLGSACRNLIKTVRKTG
jgi:2-dehydro-3-deoxyglucarate aldolase